MPGVTLRAYWNRPEDFYLAENLMKEFGGQYCTPELADIAGDPTLDGVLVCTMHNDRLRILEAMAKAGKPVLMEKPLAHSPEPLRAMHRLLRQFPILFQSAYKIRFHSLMERARQLIPHPEILCAHVWDGMWPDNHLNQKEIGGGNVRSQGVYGAESLHILAGNRPVAVNAMVRNGRQPSGIEDTLVAVFEFAGGALGTLSVADAGAGPGWVSKFLVEAAGGGGGVALGTRFTQLDYQASPGAPQQTFQGVEDGFRRQTEAFLSALRNGTPSPCDFIQGAIPSIMIEQAIASARAGCRLPIDIEGWLGEVAEPV